MRRWGFELAREKKQGSSEQIGCVGSPESWVWADMVDHRVLLRLLLCPSWNDSLGTTLHVFADSTLFS